MVVGLYLIVRKNMFKFFVILMACMPLYAVVVEHQGDSFLEIVQEQQILHLKGSPYEMGYAHGKLLKEKIQRNISAYIDQKRDSFEERTAGFQQNLPILISNTPQHILEEMQGLAAGAEVPFSKILTLNLFPEMFHCSGIAAFGEAAKDGKLVHARVLDYAIGKGLQETAVLIVAEPTGKIPFVNVSYAGFVGSVTGMNRKQIAIGEMGGKGYGSWDGMPMAFLMRTILENADTLDAAKEILSQTKRTCEYYYVVSDGKAQDAFGVHATAEKIQFISPGTYYTIYPLEQPEGLSYEQPLDCVAVTGCDRYPILKERLEENFGSIDAAVMQAIIRQPVAMGSNLHNAIFVPSELKIWVSHAGPADEPACDQPYFMFSLDELFTSDLGPIEDLQIAKAIYNKLSKS